MDSPPSTTPSVIEIYDNSKGRNVAYTFFVSGNEFGFFIFTCKKFMKIPFNVEIISINGNIKPKHSKFLNMMKNMADSYCSYSDGGVDIITEQKQELRLFRMKDYFITHNIFTSIVYTICSSVPKPFLNITNHIANMIGIKSLEIFNSNYYLHFYRSDDARKLAIIETKVYFWWNLFHRNRAVDDNEYFSFYLWIFNNMNRLNTPHFPGNIKRQINSFVKYFSIIETTTRVIDLFIFRYGPKFLTDEELINDPEKLYTYINFDKCKTNLRLYSEFLHKFG